MQTAYLEIWLGVWPAAIDWTAAVLNTQLASALTALSKARDAGSGLLLRRGLMTNTQGLYVDGFHISGRERNETQCDSRNEMVYSYNQGVILSGLRGLWESTGNTTYSQDGHDLVRKVVKATGWLVDPGLAPSETREWAGLGRAGILEDFCGAERDCSQDAQAFKGIYLHHLGQFCEPLPREPLYPGKTFAADKELAALHRASCQAYAPWIAHNARAALETRNSKGQFGGWWGASRGSDHPAVLPSGAVDYRNNASELLHSPWTSSTGGQQYAGLLAVQEQLPIAPRKDGSTSECRSGDCVRRSEGDWNDHGRGRTVETQGGGVALLSTLLELVSMA
ncbi:hypothetical protein BST61_g3654 [Cercospora zeina]